MDLSDNKTREAVEAIIEKEMAVYSAPLTTEYWGSKVWRDTLKMLKQVCH